MVRQVDVVIAGAGVSGLYAAMKLRDAGVEVAVLEARDRVGGMTYSPHSPILNQRVDLGGQWVGTLHERMYELIRRFDAPIVRQFTTGQRVRIHGSSTYFGAMGTVPGLSQEEAAEYAMAIRTLEDILKRLPDNLWEGSLAAELDAQTFADWVARTIDSENARGLFNRMTSSYYGVNSAHISALDALNKVKACGGPVFQAGVGVGAQAEHLVGSATVSERLADELGCVHLSAAVRQVNWDSQGVNVTTHDGQWRARHMIFAMSPTMVAKVAFNPGLPPNRVALHRGFPMGQYTKIVLTYESQFWREAGLSGNLICSDGSIGSVFDMGDDTASYPVLAALFGGVAADGVARLSREDRKTKVLNRIAQAFGPKALKPVDYQEHVWADDPWSEGASCAFTTPGAITGIGDKFYAPTGPFYWAGTQAAKRFPGYMEGALIAGEDAAGQIIQARSSRVSEAHV